MGYSRTLRKVNKMNLYVLAMIAMLWAGMAYYSATCGGKFTINGKDVESKIARALIGPFMFVYALLSLIPTTLYLLFCFLFVVIVLAVMLFILASPLLLLLALPMVW